jgi:hypothetical protein
MSDESEDERIAEMIGEDKLNSLPKWIHDEFTNHGNCSECGSQTLSFSPEMYDKSYICYSCSTEYTYDEMPEPVVEEVVDPEDEQTEKEVNEQKIREQKNAQIKSKDRMSMVLIILGILFGLTVIGLPIAAVLIYLGIRISPDPEDRVELDE